jgi:hypothetical protein
MHQQRIHHYTDLESLAMILSTRKLRFSRLDGVDDVREAQTHAGVNFGKYFFVSCWTQQAEESIPQWSMYSHEMRGVRIELREYPFRNEPLRPKAEWPGIQWSGDLLSPIPFEDLWGQTYFIAPMFLKQDHFAGAVDYIEDIQGVYDRCIRRELHSNGTVSLKIDGLPLLPRKKSSEWSFQKEYRFSLFAMPSLPLPAEGPGSKEFSEAIGQFMSNSLVNNIDPGINYIDVSMAPDAFDDAVIRLGPLASAGTRVCVESLLFRFAPRARVERSSLEGAVRARLR